MERRREGENRRTSPTVSSPPQQRPRPPSTKAEAIRDASTVIDGARSLREGNQMTTYLFAFQPATNEDYKRAEAALKPIGCWLEGPRRRASVACSGRHAHVATEMTKAAEKALENARVREIR